MNETPDSVLASRQEFKEVPTTAEFLSAHQGATDRPTVGKWADSSDHVGFTVRDKYLNHWTSVLKREGVPMEEGLLAVQNDEKDIFYRIELSAEAREMDLERMIDSNLPD